MPRRIEVILIGTLGLQSLLLLSLVTSPIAFAVTPASTSSTDWFPNGRLNYTYVWPGDPLHWGISGNSAYQLNLTVGQKIYIDFAFTYSVNQNVDLGLWIINRMPLGLFSSNGQITGYVLQFDFLNPPTASVGSMQPITGGPVSGDGYSWSQLMKAGDKLVIAGRLTLVNATAVNLADLGLALGQNRNAYTNSYMPVADFVFSGNKTLIPSTDLWGTLGIPLPKSAVDTIQQTASLQTQLSSVQSQVSTLQSQLTSTQATVSSLKANNSALQSSVSNLQSQLISAQTTVSSLTSDKASLESQLSQTRYMFYGSAAAAVVLLAVAVVLAVRRGK